MDDELIYWNHPTPIGIRVEEVSGMSDKGGRLWREMALQIYCENGRDGYREIGHYANGAPFLFGQPMRISLTHTDHLLAIAQLPKTPEADLSVFSSRTALGIDAEKLTRAQVIKVRNKFLTDHELQMIPEDDIEKNIIAWTSKEALYKAALTEGLDFKNNLIIESLPVIDRDMNIPGSGAPIIGSAKILFPENKVPSLEGAETLNEVEMKLYSYLSDGYCITLAYSPKCAKFKKK